MWTKKETEIFLFGFAITTMIWVFLFSFILGTVSIYYEKKIKEIKKENVDYKSN